MSNNGTAFRHFMRSPARYAPNPDADLYLKQWRCYRAEMKTCFLSCLTALIVVTALAAPPSANQVLSDAKAKAASEDKAIFVHFGASWCGWCKRLEAFLERPEIKPVFEKYFVPVKLVVQENEKNKALENGGSDAVLKS